MNVYSYFCVLCVVYLTNRGANVGSVAAYDESYVIASVGSTKELSCRTQTSMSPNQVSWYRVTNSDIRWCSIQPYVFDGPSVFCDRLTNSRNVQDGFKQRFSVPSSGTENVNGLIITGVELSDAGMYACVLSNNKILARINFNAEEVGSTKELSCTTQTSISPNQVSWYRITNSDIRRCPNQPYVFDGPSVVCDRLTNNRNVQPAFRQRFSVPPSGSENVNGLIITRVKLSDAGTYACVHNNSMILARINFTTEETTVKETMLEITQETSEVTEHAATREALVVTTVMSPTEFGTTTIAIISVVCLLVGFIAGLFVATAILKNRPGIIATNRNAAINHQGAKLPADGARNRPARVDNYCELNVLDINPSGVYTELHPVDTSTSMPVHENTTSMEMPLYDDVVHSMVETSHVSTSAAYEEIFISK